MEVPRDFEREIRLLRHHLSQALDLGKACTTGAIVTDNDDFGFMALNFLCKQMDHAESMLLLIPRRDICLIARTMFDGLCQLLWANQDAVARGHQWRSFAWIHDWRLMQAELAKGNIVDETMRKKTESLIDQYGQVHTKNTSRTADPYHPNWRAGVQLKTIVAAVGGSDAYDGVYGSMSDWEHWGVAGIGDSLSRSDNRLTFSSESLRVCAQSLTVGFQSLFQTIEILDRHLELGKFEAVNSLKNAMFKDFGISEIT